MKKTCLILSLFLVTLVLSGCMPAYQKEISVVVQPWQTAYLVPLEGKIENQKKMNSAAAYEEFKVASKRIIIPTRFNQTGRMSWDGNYIPMMEVIIVDRTPTALHWTADANSGTGQRNEAIWLESSNSIAFSIPFVIIGYIEESDASNFLYFYSRGKLAQVLNTEGRNKVMEVVAEYSNSMPLDQLIQKYDAINNKIREVVITYFKSRGITITAIGIAGFSTYRDPAIAGAIDGVFAAQQLQAVELAKSDAAKKHQEVTEAEGQAEAARTREMSKGPSMSQKVKADAQREADAMVGEAKAKAISILNTSLQEAAQSDLFLKNMELEVQLQFVEKWSGETPLIVSGDNTFIPGQKK